MWCRESGRERCVVVVRRRVERGGIEGGIGVVVEVWRCRDSCRVGDGVKVPIRIEVLWP